MNISRRQSWPSYVLLVSVLLVACNTTPAPPATADERSLAPTQQPSASASARPATPDVAALPGGLEPRPQLPPLADGEAAACIPDCGVGRTAGGAMPNGRYQTHWFFGGYMTLETDDRWALREDSNGELAVFLPGDTEYAIAFWLDPEPYRHGQRVPGVGQDAGAFLDWLASNPDLVVSEERAAMIGEVPTTSVDIELSATAGQDETGCGADPCISFINDPAFDHVDGILGDDVYRFYFADVTYAATDHLLVAMIEGRDQTHVDSIAPTIDELLSTVTIPARRG